MEIDLCQIFAALNDAQVRYLVVGGVAVVLHGHLRMTADLDLIVALDRENVLRALHAAAGLGFRPRLPVALDDFADPVLRRSWIEEKGMLVFSLWNSTMPGLLLDIFVEEPLPFEDMYDRAVTANVGDTSLRLACIDDLIALKRAAGRPRDLEDIAALEAIQAEDKNGG